VNAVVWDGTLAVKEKPVWKFKTSGQQETSTKSTASARGRSYIIDVPFRFVTLHISAQDAGPCVGALAVVKKLGDHCVVANMLCQSRTGVIKNWSLSGETIGAG